MTRDPEHEAEREEPEDGRVADPADKRRASRRPLRTGLRMQIETGALSGRTENLSTVGVLFFSSEPLCVRVEVEEEGGLRTYKGHLVRLQRTGEGEAGFAVEFDPA